MGDMARISSKIAAVCLLLEILMCGFVVGSAEVNISCPENCTCPSSKEMNCSLIDHIPVFEGRDGIYKMTIKNHSITRIQAGDFENFTRLSQLTISGGNITNITTDAFKEVRQTLTRLELTSNHIKEIDKDIFVNFTELQDLELNFNDLTRLKTGTFMNLVNLTTLKIKFNSIKELESDVFIDIPNIESLVLFSNLLTQLPWSGIRRLKGLKTLRIGKNKIADLGESAHVFLEKLEDIDLSENPLWRLGTFPNVSNSLTILNIAFTHLDSVSKHAWKNVPQLEKLYMEGTRFYEITQGMFAGLANLQELFLTDMDNLMIVGPHAFAGLDKIHSIDLSRNKKLYKVDEDAFVDTQVSSVKLFQSGITSFSEKLFRWEEMKSIFISPNPVTCDCNVKWMADTSLFKNNTDAEELECALPENLAGRKVVSLSPSSFVCTTHTSDRPPRFLTGLVVAIVVFVVFSAFALLFKFRHQIMIKCRRYFQYRRYRNDMIFTVENDTAVAELDDTESRPLTDMRLETVPLEANA